MSLNDLYDRRSEPDARAVLADARLARGERPGRIGVELDFAAAAANSDADAAAADANSDAAAAADANSANSDAAAAAAAAANSDAADAAAAAANSDADAAAADANSANAISGLNQILKQEPDMKDGLKIIQLPGGYYGYSITRVGWVRRVAGDDYELVGGRTMAREGQYSLDGITKAAAKGPKGYRLSVVDERPEELHRLLIRRAVTCDEKAWADACPKPRGWVES